MSDSVVSIWNFQTTWLPRKIERNSELCELCELWFMNHDLWFQNFVIGNLGMCQRLEDKVAINLAVYDQIVITLNDQIVWLSRIESLEGFE